MHFTQMTFANFNVISTKTMMYGLKGQQYLAMLHRGSKMSSFTKPQAFTEQELRGLGIAKWDQYGPDILPAWVADMDLKTAPAVQAAVAKLASQASFGYPLRNGRSPDREVAEIYAERMHRLYNWKVDPENTLVVSDLVQSIYACLFALSEKHSGIAVQTPNYPPFRAAIEATNRHMISIPAEMVDGAYHWNFGGSMDDCLRDAKILIVCNPQNPTGRVLTRNELQDIAAFAERYNLIILADEIHADLVYDARKHIPIASLDDAVAQRTITLASATKSFSIAGLRCGLINFGSAELRKKFAAKIPPQMLGQPSIVGIDATIAAWTESDDWLANTVGYLTDMRDYAHKAIRERIPLLDPGIPEGTYLMWIDCTRLLLNESASQFFLKKAKIMLSAGETFEPGATNFVRLNFATSREILDAIIDRMANAVCLLHGGGQLNV